MALTVRAFGPTFACATGQTGIRLARVTSREPLRSPDGKFDHPSSLQIDAHRAIAARVIWSLVGGFSPRPAACSIS